MRSLYTQVCLEMHGVLDTLRRSTWRTVQVFYLGGSIYLLADFFVWPGHLAFAADYVLTFVGGVGLGLLYARSKMRQVLVKQATPCRRGHSSHRGDDGYLRRGERLMRSLYAQVCLEMHGVMDTLQRLDLACLPGHAAWPGCLPARGLLCLA